MSAFVVKRSVAIAAPVERVYSLIVDFARWRAWSPWLIMEPEAKVTITPDGSSYTWAGKNIGEGSMQRVSTRAPSKIEFDLTFLKPWKSRSKTSFALEGRDAATVVTWDMVGSIPFFLFFMKKMMDTLVGSDFDRGLAMLKDLAETGSVPSRLSFDGLVDYPGCTYVAIQSESSVAEVGPRMAADFQKLGAWAAQESITPASRPFAQYLKWDLGKGTTRFITAIPVAVVPPTIPDGFISGRFAATTAYCVTHTGAYRHLANAWSAAMSHRQARLFRKNGALSPFEIYETGPGETAEDAAITRVMYPAVR